MEKTKMAHTPAQLRAIDKYKKKNIVNVALQFNKKTEPELTDYVQTLQNKTGYIKGLIRADANIGANSWILFVNDEDEIRHYVLTAHTAAEAEDEARRIIGLFDGWLKGRIDKSDWHIIRAKEDPSSPKGIVDDDEEPIYLFQGE